MLALGVTYGRNTNKRNNKTKTARDRSQSIGSIVRDGNFYYSNQAQLRLAQIAMPDLVADELEQETLE